MISHISAAYIYPVTGNPIKNGVLAVDPMGIIKAVYTEEQAKERQINHITHYKGLLTPGFVNTHCHLELSSLKGKIAKGTGLPEFVQSVIKLRRADEDETNQAMISADAELYANGVVAVGDISNLPISKALKSDSSIYYFTFLELMGFNPTMAQKAIENAKRLKNDFAPLPVSLVPHAPYSVSAELFNEIASYSQFQDGPLSIHNQETADENLFFEQKAGGFLRLFEFLGQDIGFYTPSGKTSLHTYLPLLSPQLKTLLVHNTYTSAEDVAYATCIHPNLYWCLCPKANLYIENRLPDVNMMRKAGIKITLGTDSLASNDGLSILSEMNVLQERFDVPVEELLRWATFNGAEFLEIAQRFGSFEEGKQPGVNLIDFTEKDGKVILGNKVRRLF
uniref:amidohydrolase family protein n=1 Tax=Pedobacter schmidteae TaxID=2201271 RepID=UPI000EB59A86|nr:amidohydrolase family protein [Pedobacter schmidteae]